MRTTSCGMMERMGITPQEIERRKEFLEFGAEDIRALQSIDNLAEQYAGEMIDDFYQHLLSFAEGRDFFRDPGLLDHVKQRQREYLLGLTHGEYGTHYIEKRLVIGAIHERIGLPMKLYLGMYSYYLRAVANRVLTALGDEPERARETFLSLLKLTFLDMGLAIDTYMQQREHTIHEQQEALRAEALARAALLEEIQRKNAALETANRHLVAVNHELEAFSYSVSHDLRAPLRSIAGFSQMMFEDYGERLDEQGKEYLTELIDTSHDMARLIDAMLRLSRVTRAEMRWEEVDLSSLARLIAGALAKTEPEREVTVAVAEGLIVEGDERLLHCALENLLGNAWKFTRRTGSASIELGTAIHEGQRAYVVRDNGAGFDMAYGQHLFGAFQRLHSAREFEGTGIGLATVRRIIHRHGGKVWAEGRVGHGAAFYFTLPDSEETAAGMPLFPDGGG
jgi:signal transduction histidine kinase